jgi:hypothetical protein
MQKKMRIIFNIEPDFLTISSGIEFLPTPIYLAGSNELFIYYCIWAWAWVENPGNSDEEQVIDGIYDDL